MFGHSRARRWVFLAEDGLLLALPVLCLVFRPVSPLWWGLAAGALLALAWNACTLHFPREILLDDEGISFRGYGREHRFLWASCRVSVRRFLVKDRVLVRMTGRDGPFPLHALRGRYWLLDSIHGYDALVRELGARGALADPAPKTTASLAGSAKPDPP